MKQERKAVKPYELVVGEIYSDIPKFDTPPVFLKFVGLKDDDRRVCFEYVSGGDFYLNDDDGLISFHIHSEFYLPTESELQTLKQTK